jgi:hypothetical protein
MDQEDVPVLMSLLHHNKYLRALGRTLQLSNENPDRRRQVSELAGTSDRDIITDVEKRIANHNRLNETVQKSQLELRKVKAQIKVSIGETLNDLQNHNNKATATRAALSEIEYGVRELA